MNILVYPHQMVIGGSQINALELAARIRDRGHTVTVVAPDGPLVEMVTQLGLPYYQTVSDSDEVSLRTGFQLAGLVRRLEIDVIHAYEWRPALEASYVPHFLSGVPLVVTVLSMSVPNFIPKHLPLIVGTAELGAMMRSKGRPRIEVMEPPVDVEMNRSGDIARARSVWSFQPDEIVVAVICRMTSDLQKLEGVLEAMEVIGDLAQDAPLRFLVVGGGEGIEEVTRRAEEVNSRFGHPIIVVAGPMSDPREAYEASDIVLGMGSSALRGMVFAKPLVVQGSNGFWRLLDPDSVDLFLWQGWYGDGGNGPGDLRAILRRLLSDRSELLALGEFGRELAERRFSLDHAAATTAAILEQAVCNAKTGSNLSSLARSAASYGKCLINDMRRRAGAVV
ncbi:glycosyltransferase [Devosia sp. YIM 151766]|uniref:glycosyltransferase n=1 Tax=Devosia sp. YIM 151766 TaxID=3017325 RepID=UPI00255C943E|nr:glycosyltransferase [Devosia sp. YIM 151766]WIY54204.1 glycosyltransferase [Devosia sp. YIM 151766]